jgi:hypothetical protein
MNKILSTLVAAGLLAGAANIANAKFDPFNDPSAALPRSEKISNDDFKQALPRSEIKDPFTDPSLPLPLTDATFPDIVIATP